MKKIILGFALAVLFFGFAATGLSGCGERAKGGRLKIVCTCFPQYDWVKNIAMGDESVDLTLLGDSGSDLHNYQPTTADIVKIYTCDVFICVGGESETWTEDVLKSASVNPAMKKISLLEALGGNALREEESPGAEEKEEGEALDEHVWLSLRAAKTLCTSIAETLCEINPSGEALYRSNLQSYSQNLDGLEKEYSSAVGSAARKVFLFGDRFPFRYLANDYGLTYFAAFAGCSAESQASFSVITNLARLVDKNDLPYILVLEGSDKRIAEQIKANTRAKDQEILVINSIQSVTAAQIANGASYFAFMQENLEVLKKALN